MAQRPNNQEIHRLADESIRSTTYSIVDHSGWQGWNHRYVLIELNPDVDPDRQDRRAVVVQLIERNWNWQDTGESPAHWRTSNHPRSISGTGPSRHSS